MKPPETVTLIDLQGNPIPLRENVPIHYFTGEYAHIVELERPHSLSEYRIYVGSSVHVGHCTKDYDSLLRLVLFLNDQLTFIRNGMWKTLAIYQKTLGRFAEVPWYPFDTKGNDLVMSLGFDRATPLSAISAGYYYDSSAKHNSIWLPRLKEFLTCYDTVFSKLTPCKGE